MILVWVGLGLVGMAAGRVDVAVGEASDKVARLLGRR